MLCPHNIWGIFVTFAYFLTLTANRYATAVMHPIFRILFYLTSGFNVQIVLAKLHHCNVFQVNQLPVVQTPAASAAPGMAQSCPQLEVYVQTKTVRYSLKMSTFFGRLIYFVSMILLELSDLTSIMSVGVCKTGLQ